MRGSVTKRLPAGHGEELLAAIGPIIAELYPERPLRSGTVRGVSKEALAKLIPPPLPPTVFWSTSAVSVAALAVAAGFGLAFRSDLASRNTLAQESLSTPIASSRLEALRSQALEHGQLANVAFGVSGALAVASGIEAIFTNWRGSVHASVKTVELRLQPTGLEIGWR